MHLTSDGAKLTVEYPGTYAYVRRVVRASGVPVFDLHCPSKELSSVGAFFSDAEDVRLKLDGKRLRISGGRRKATVAIIDREGIDREAPYDPIVTVPYQRLADEFRAVSNAPAANYAAPILTGIRLVSGRDRIDIQACNAISIVYESVIASDVVTEGEEMVIPPRDLAVGMSIMAGSESVTIGRSGKGRFALVNDDTVFVGALLTGVWPDLEKMRVRPSTTCQLSSTLLREVIRAADVFSSGNVITFTPTSKGRILLSTQESQLGEYVVAAEGVLDQAINIDVGDAAVAAALGDDLEMGVENGTIAFRSGDRALYSLSRLTLT